MSDELTASEKAVAQAMYDIKPNMIGAMKLAKAISAMVDEKLAARSMPIPIQHRRPGRPRKAAA